MTIESHRKACLKYSHSEKGKKKRREWEKKHKKDSDAKYYQKNKEKLLKQSAAYKKNHTKERIESSKKYYEKNREKIDANAKKYRQKNRNKCNMYYKKNKAKRNRDLNWILMFDNPFDELEIIDWHHINNAYVVAIPRDLHRHYQGKYHREKLMEIVKQIYLGDRKHGEI